MEVNRVHHGDWMDNTLPDKSVQLIIADPPYFEIKGHFDYVWPSFDAYLADVDRWAQECKRVLADNGTLFWWGHFRRIAYAQVIFDKLFDLKASVVWERKESKIKVWGADNFRAPIPVTERLLMYANDGEPYEWANTNECVQFVFRPIYDWFAEEWAKSGLTRAQVDKACGTSNVTQYWFLVRNFQIPTREKYEILQSLTDKAFRREYEDLRREYEDLRREYEDLRRPYNTSGELVTDVIRWSQESHITRNYKHETKKPLGLSRKLVRMCSRPGDLVLVPFAGSGTECEAAVMEGRKFIGYDIEYRYVEMANERCRKHIEQPMLFT